MGSDSDSDHYSDGSDFVFDRLDHLAATYGGSMARSGDGTHHGECPTDDDGGNGDEGPLPNDRKPPDSVGGA